MNKDELTPAEKQEKEKSNLSYRKIEQTHRRVISVAELIGDKEEMYIERMRDLRKEEKMLEAEREERRYW